MLELDHVFVCCSEGAPEAAALARLGLTEGSPNTHPGQGTACRRFFFANTYLELVWVSDAEEAQRDDVRPTRLWERWAGRRTGACPFAVVLRPSAGAETSPVPFPTWRYRPRYLPPDLGIDVACDAPLDEPAFFYAAFGRRPDALGRQPIAHACGVSEVTGVELVLPTARPLCSAAQAAAAAGVVAFSPGDAHVLCLTFDHGRRAQAADLRPELPLRLRW